MALDKIYGQIKRECYSDESGVYKDSERVSVDNSHNSGYTRWNGNRSIERIGLDDSLVTKPFIFVGAVPKGNPALVLYATVAELVSEGATILNATFDKGVIAEEEGIDLSKFDGVVLIRVTYQIVTHETYCKPVVVPQPCWILETGIWDADCEWTANGIWNA